MNYPHITDTTLRDGSHAIHHRFSKQQVHDIAQALDAAGIPVMEVAHGDGLGGSSLQSGFAATDDGDVIEIARSVAKQAKITALLIPGIGTSRDLREAAKRGVQIVRIATHCTEANMSEQHIGLAKELGLDAVGFLMMTHMRPPKFLAEQATLMQSYGADSILLADSAGAMLPPDVAARVSTVKEAVSVPVGFHAHNNLGAAVANSLAALGAGATRIDGSLRGFGAGAGNTPTELLAAVIDKMGFNSGLDVFRLMDAAEFVVAPFIPFQPIPDRDAIAIGYAGVYSTFMLQAKKISKEFGIDALDIVAELGKRGAIVGQEDLVLEVAHELAGNRK
ncbi:MAG: 4-hydroxy-2-oxovalerate aldolase [Armatimonadetes bacterium]|nr:4-hydroxy-2-oxovalerate aldolase [Armatimonadota bacterium]